MPVPFNVLVSFSIPSGAQEISRAVFCHDSPLNSAIGGAAAGTVLYGAHQANPRTGAFICGCIGAVAHLISDMSYVNTATKHVLVSSGLLDESALESPAPEEASEAGSSWWATIEPYMPIRRTTEEEWERYQEERRRKMMALLQETPQDAHEKEKRDT